MKYTKEEIIQYIEEEDVKFIRLAFTDIFGKQKNISIMPYEIRRAFKTGIAFDASAVTGFSSVEQSDYFLHPDPETLVVLPWRPEHGRVVRMYCSITDIDGNPSPFDTRHILAKAIEDAKRLGYTFHFGSELEFYLFHLDDQGQRTMIPYDNAGYMDIAPDDKGENVRREVCLTLERMGIIPESSHHEEGPGQNEIDFRYSDALTAADQAITFQTVVKTIANRNGLFADFSPKPIPTEAGNGFHINISMEKDGKRMSEKMMNNMIAGILNYVPDITLFFNPSENSYLRLGNHKAPRYISWSRANRSQFIRVPAAPVEHTRLELRSPDATANPYIAFALIIYAALHGLTNKLEAPAPIECNLFNADSEEMQNVRKIPESLSDAVNRAAKSSFVAEHLPKNIIELYTELR